VRFRVEIEREYHGRWLAHARVQALALRGVADRLEHGEAGPDLLDISLALLDELARHSRAASSGGAPSDRLERETTKRTGLTPKDFRNAPVEELGRILEEENPLS
jgi:IS5 family transposase